MRTGLFVVALLAAAPPRGTAQEPTDLPEGKQLVSFTGKLWQARWSQDGKSVVTCTTRRPADAADRVSFGFKTIEVWDATTGKRLQSLGELENPRFPFVYLSADGSRLVASHSFRLGTNEFEVWDVARATLTHQIEVVERSRPIDCVVFAPKGDLVAVLSGTGNYLEAGATGTGFIDVYSTATGKKLRTLTNDGTMPRTAAFSPDGKLLVTRGTNDRLRVYDVATGKAVRDATASAHSAGEIIVSPDGTRLIVPTGRREPVQVFSLPDLKPLPGIPNPYLSIFRVAFSPSGKRLVVSGSRTPFTDPGGGQRGAIVWDVERARVLHDWSTPISDCGFCGDDRVGIATPDEITTYPITPAPPPRP